MNEILQQNPWFRPSQATIKKWLFTRKQPLLGTNFSSPGLFGTANFGTDMALFILAVLLEIGGLIAFYQVTGSILFALLFFVLDFIFAIGSHWNQDRMTILKNQMALIRDFSFGEKNDTDQNHDLKPIAARILWREQAMSRYKMISAFFYILIVGIAIFKILGFMNGFAQTGEEFGTFPLLVIIAYTLIAFIHIYATGYFFSELYFRWAVNSDLGAHLAKNEFSVSIENPYKAKDIHIMAGSEFTYPNPPDIPGLPAPAYARPHIKFNNHWIKYTTLYTFGILTDLHITQLQMLMNDPGGSALTQKKDTFIKYALHHQLTTILSDNAQTNPQTPPPPAIPAPPPAPVFPLPAENDLVSNDNASYPWFAPSHATKKKWLFTRKRPYDAGNFRAPGFFGTDKFGTDATLFFLAVILEIIGLSMFYAYLDNILFAVLFFVLDFILAIGSHWNKGRGVELNNQLALLRPICNPDYRFAEKKDDDSKGVRKNSHARIHWRESKLMFFNLYAGIFYFFIAMLGVVKIFGFYNGWTTAGMEFNAIPMLVIVTYAMVAVIHIFVTGYFFSELYFRYYYNKEKNEHKLTHNYTIPGYLVENDVTPFPIPEPGLNSDNHHIIGHNLYTFGVLTDKQIRTWKNPVSLLKISIEDFTKQCIYHQMIDILPNEPNPAENPIRVNNMVPMPMIVEEAPIHVEPVNVQVTTNPGPVVAPITGSEATPITGPEQFRQN